MPTKEQNERFPSGVEAVFVIVALFAAEYLAGAAVRDGRTIFGLDRQDFDVLAVLLGNGILFVALMQYKHLSYRALFHSSRNSLVATVSTLSEKLRKLCPFPKVAEESESGQGTKRKEARFYIGAFRDGELVWGVVSAVSDRKKRGVRLGTSRSDIPLPDGVRDGILRADVVVALGSDAVRGGQFVALLINQGVGNPLELLRLECFRCQL